MSAVGIDIAREGAASDIDRVFLAWQVAFREFRYVLSTGHVRLHPCHLYMKKMEEEKWVDNISVCRIESSGFCECFVCHSYFLSQNLILEIDHGPCL